jgi:osmotically-inducible protein OsmY
VPVTSDGKLVGIVSRANLLHGLVARGAAPAASADDREIREKFAEALKEAGLRTEYIDVVVADGVLQLWGSVVSKEELDAVRVAAENVDGVKGVENHVSILSQILRPGLYA